MINRMRQISIISALLKGHTVKFDGAEMVMSHSNCLCVKAENLTTHETVLLNPEVSFAWLLNAIDRMSEEDVVIVQASVVLTESKSPARLITEGLQRECDENARLVEERLQKECDEIAQLHDDWMGTDESL
jgi:hypothetical protein